MKRYLVALVLAAVPAQVMAQDQAVCGLRDFIADRLAAGYGEARVAAGLMADTQNMIEVFVSRETGTWTILVTAPSGTSCFVAVGRSWMEIPAPIPGEPG